MMNSGVEASEAVDRVARRGRTVRGVLVGAALLLCTAGGFASARLWDGRGTSDMDLEFAHAVALDDDLDYARRRTALGRLSFFATNSVEAMVECETDPRFETDVEVFLGQLRQFLPEPKTLDHHLAGLKDPGRSAEDRLALATKVYIHAARAVYDLGLAKKRAEKAGKTEVAEEIERHLVRIRELLDGAVTGSAR